MTIRCLDYRIPVVESYIGKMINDDFAGRCQNYRLQVFYKLLALSYCFIVTFHTLFLGNYIVKLSRLIGLLIHYKAN